jgi:hypothetical protein
LGEIPAGAVAPPNVAYYLEAVDASPAANPSTFPAGGAAQPLVVSIDAVDRTPPAIVHTPVAGAQPAGVDVAIEAQVRDDSGVGEVTLSVRGAGGASFVTITLARSSGDTFAGVIPGALVQGVGVDYYLEATDASTEDNRARLPATAPTDVFSFGIQAVGPDDRTPPAILHLPPSGTQRVGAALPLVAEVVDPSGVASVVVAFRAKGEADFTEVTMAREGTTDRWRVELPGERVTVAGVEYFIRATDAAAAMNVGQRPESAPAELFSVAVGAGPSPSPSPTPDPLERGSGGGCACGATRPDGLLEAVAVLAIVAGMGRRRRR